MMRRSGIVWPLSCALAAATLLTGCGDGSPADQKLQEEVLAVPLTDGDAQRLLASRPANAVQEAQPAVSEAGPAAGAQKPATGEAAGAQEPVTGEAAGTQVSATGHAAGAQEPVIASAAPAPLIVTHQLPAEPVPKSPAGTAPAPGPAGDVGVGPHLPTTRVTSKTAERPASAPAPGASTGATTRPDGPGEVAAGSIAPLDVTAPLRGEPSSLPAVTGQSRPSTAAGAGAIGVSSRSRGLECRLPLRPQAIEALWQVERQDDDFEPSRRCLAAHFRQQGDSDGQRRALQEAVDKAAGRHDSALLVELAGLELKAGDYRRAIALGLEAEYYEHKQVDADLYEHFVRIDQLLAEAYERQFDADRSAVSLDRAKSYWERFLTKARERQDAPRSAQAEQRIQALASKREYAK